jgi:hypothetical protein
MGIFSRLFGNKPQGTATGDHAVIVHFDYGSTDLTPLSALEEQLEEAINGAGVGEFDGNEVAVDGSDGSLYMYGPNADRLFETVRPVLERSTAIRNAVATVRYGPPGDDVRSMNVPLNPLR